MALGEEAAEAEALVPKFKFEKLLNQGNYHRRPLKIRG
jgi:hypothetical protein